METSGMALYRLSCGLLSARGYFFPAWDKLSQEDKDYWQSLAEAYSKHAIGDYDREWSNR